MLQQYTDLVFALTIFQTIFFFVFLVTHPKRTLINNRILAAYLLSIFLVLCNELLFKLGLHLSVPFFVYQGSKFIYLTGPLLYFYTCSLTRGHIDLNWRSALHLIPFAAFSGVMLFAYDLKPSAEQIRLLVTDDTILHPSVSYGFLLLYYLQLISYVAVSLKLVHDYRTRIRHIFASTEGIGLAWLRFVLWGFAVIWLFDVTMLAVKEIYPEWQSIYAWLVAVSRTYTFTYILIFVFQGLRHPAIFLELNGAGPAAKYESSPLTDELKQKYLEKLLDLMNSAKPFLDPEISINQVAQELGIKSKYLSQIINEKTGRNFFDFVNGYRIEEAKRRLKRNGEENATILEILYDVGFNSKSSFNTAFKKHTHLTPSQFKRQYQHEIS